MSSEEITENINEVKEKTLLDTTLGFYSVFMGLNYALVCIYTILAYGISVLGICIAFMFAFTLFILASIPLVFLMHNIFPITDITGLLILIACILTKEITFKSLKLNFERPYKTLAFFIYWLGFLLYILITLFLYNQGKYIEDVDWMFNFIFSIVLTCLFFAVKKRSRLFIVICLLVILNINYFTDYINACTYNLRISKNFKGFVKLKMPSDYKYKKYDHLNNNLYKISDNKYLLFSKKEPNKKNFNLIGIINTKTYKLEKYITEKDYCIKPISQLPDGNIYIMVENENIKGLHPAVFDVKDFKIKNIDYEKNFLGYEFIKLENNNILMYKPCDVIHNPNKTKSYQYFKSLIYDIHTGEYTESFKYPYFRERYGITLNDDEILFTQGYEYNNKIQNITVCSIKNKKCKNSKIKGGYLSQNSFKIDKGQIITFHQEPNDEIEILLFNPYDNSLKKINSFKSIINYKKQNKSSSFVQLNNGNILITNEETGEIKIFDIKTNNINTLDMKLTPKKMHDHFTIMLDDNKILVFGIKNIGDFAYEKHIAEIMFL